MKSESEVRQKLKQVIYRHLKKRLRSNFKRTPNRCLHNTSVELEPGQTVGICVFHQSTGPRGVPCDSRMGGFEQAQKCPLFEPLQTKQEVKEVFRALVESEERGPLAAEYPDVAALMWVLDQDDRGTLVPDGIEEDDAEEATKGWVWPWSRRSP